VTRDFGPPPPYEERRERLVIQVVSRWTGIDYNDDELVNAAARTAANETYHPKINDLDWQAATLRRLGFEGKTL
jgi:hypothetical protein